MVEAFAYYKNTRNGKEELDKANRKILELKKSLETETYEIEKLRKNLVDAKGAINTQKISSKEEIQKTINDNQAHISSLEQNINKDRANILELEKECKQAFSDFCSEDAKFITILKVYEIMKMKIDSVEDFKKLYSIGYQINSDFISSVQKSKF